MKTIKRDLKDGVEIGGRLAKSFEMRPATAGDMFDAEALAPPERQLAYNGALISRQLVLLGDMPGPIDYEIVRRLSPDDFAILYDAMRELETMGKPQSASGGDGTT